MKVTLLNYTPNPEYTVAAAAKLCYSESSASDLMDDLDDKKASDFIEMLSGFGHMSPIEHTSFTFAIEGVSRSFLAQITRHRIASFSVQSQRYVKQKNFIYITPPAIENDEKALEIFNNQMQDSLNAYNQLTDILQAKYEKENLSLGMNEKTAKSKAEKKAIEDARFVLPNACETKMVMTMNARSLIHFFNMRCCNRAQWEIRDVAKEMYRLAYKTAPSLFKNAGPSCVSGVCPEGNMSCKKASEVRKEYEAIRNE
jgi:thymidylate synthase (FAD)